jgi:hypothetical protein
MVFLDIPDVTMDHSFPLVLSSLYQKSQASLHAAD